MNFPPTLVLLTALTLSFWSSDLYSAVVWDRTRSEATAGLDDEFLDFSFPFHVTSSSISFLPTDIPCGCASASPNAPHYNPGDRGVFTVRLLVEDRVGPQLIEIATQTTDNNHPSDTLSIATTIPEPIRPGRKIVLWRPALFGNPQSFNVSILPGLNCTKISTVSSHPSIDPSCRWIDLGRTFEVSLRLADPAHTQPVSISIITDVDLPRKNRVTVWSIVKP